MNMHYIGRGDDRLVSPALIAEGGQLVPEQGRRIRGMNSPALIRIGGVAGVLMPLPLLGGAWITLALTENLGQFGFPWVAALGALLAGTCVIALTSVHASRWGRPLRAVGLVTSAGLIVVAAFLVGLGTEDLVVTRWGGDRFLSDNEAITAVGVLTASVFALVVVPLGLAVLGIATARSHLLASAGRLAAAAITPCLVVGAITSAATASPWAPAVWLLVISASWFLLGRSLLRAEPSLVLLQGVSHG
jgi:hypothetical protein